MNSVQFLRGQLRPVLIVMWMTLGAAQTAGAAEQVSLTPLAQVPPGVEVQGKQVAAYSWDDRQGHNLLVLAEQEAGERDDDGIVAGKQDIDPDDLQNRKPELTARKVH